MIDSEKVLDVIEDLECELSFCKAVECNTSTIFVSDLESYLDVINGQKAEVESLIAGQETLQKALNDMHTKLDRTYTKYERNHEYNLERLDKAYKDLKEKEDEIENLKFSAKSEAVKEFAERLKEKAFTHERPFEANEDKFIKLVAVESIDNLVKEMVGEI